MRVTGNYRALLPAPVGYAKAIAADCRRRVEHLHLRCAAIDEDEQAAIQGILTEFLARQGVEAIVGLPEKKPQ